MHGAGAAYERVKGCVDDIYAQKIPDEQTIGVTAEGKVVTVTEPRLSGLWSYPEALSRWHTDIKTMKVAAETELEKLSSLREASSAPDNNSLMEIMREPLESKLRAEMEEEHGSSERVVTKVNAGISEGLKPFNDAFMQVKQQLAVAKDLSGPGSLSALSDGYVKARQVKTVDNFIGSPSCALFRTRDKLDKAAADGSRGCLEHLQKEMEFGIERYIRAHNIPAASDEEMFSIYAALSAEFVLWLNEWFEEAREKPNNGTLDMAFKSFIKESASPRFVRPEDIGAKQIQAAKEEARQLENIKSFNESFLETALAAQERIEARLKHLAMYSQFELDELNPALLAFQKLKGELQETAMDNPQNLCQVFNDKIKAKLLIHRHLGKDVGIREHIQNLKLALYEIIPHKSEEALGSNYCGTLEQLIKTTDKFRD